MYGFIYITTNLINKKRYLGKCAYHRRCCKHYLGSGKVLKRALKKYGTISFKREIIDEASSEGLLSQLEDDYLEKFNCSGDPTWYNISPKTNVTNGFLGRKHLPESNKKRSDSLKGRKRPPHVGLAVSKAQKGRKLPSWHIEAIRTRMLNDHPFAESIQIDNIFYPTITAAMKALNIRYYRACELANYIPKRKRNNKIGVS